MKHLTRCYKAIKEVFIFFMMAISHPTIWSYIGYVWKITMCFITYMMIRNVLSQNSYLWWMYRNWIQDHTFESVFVLASLSWCAYIYCKEELY